MSGGGGEDGGILPPWMEPWARAHYRSQETLDAKLADRCNIINSY
jgi:hypothetical protein